MSNPGKRLKLFLTQWDGIWSFPLAICAFLGSGYALQYFFTDPADPQGGPGFYDPSFIQVAFYASCMQVGLNFCVWLGMFFNFRGIWRYYAGDLNESGALFSKSKDDFKYLLPWQRIKLLLFVYCFLSVEWLFLFKSLQ